MRVLMIFIPGNISESVVSVVTDAQVEKRF